MPSNLDAYRASRSEQERLSDLFALIPARGSQALDIGTRDGYLARALAERFDKVVALDLEKPDIEDPKIEAVRGDVTALAFVDNMFDTVLCAEVLEHIPQSLLVRACHEIARVAKDKVVIGVPYRQDLRCGRTTCESCGKINPPWGHVNSFDEHRLRSLFPTLTMEKVTFVGISSERTNSISVALLDYAGNPFGTWDQDEHCVHCGSPIGAPRARNVLQRLATRTAILLNRLQESATRSHGKWIHVLFCKPSVASLPAKGRDLVV